MSETSTLYTIIVYSENNVGLLSQLSNIFTRRGVNIESISSGLSSRPDVHKITITCVCTPEMVVRLTQQISKRIDVIRVYYYEDDELVYEEVALFKVPTDKMLDEKNLEEIIRRHNARILELTRDYTVIEKTGHKGEIDTLFEELRVYDIRQFVRSGRIAITKSPIEHVDNFLQRREADIKDNMI